VLVIVFAVGAVVFALVVSVIAVFNIFKHKLNL
jgi:hypothetical protein